MVSTNTAGDRMIGTLIILELFFGKIWIQAHQRDCPMIWWLEFFAVCKKFMRSFKKYQHERGEISNLVNH